jgi:DNA-binding response OmpR family regulator
MKTLRILIVEDDSMLAFLLGEVLMGLGHEVCATEGVEAEAIATALRCRPDLMIVDEILGAGSGLAVVDAVLEQTHAPHLFVSGDAARIRTLRPKAIVIEKPYSESDLAYAIEKTMQLDISESRGPLSSEGVAAEQLSASRSATASGLIR